MKSSKKNGASNRNRTDILGVEVLYTSRCAILAFAPNVLFYN